MMDPHGEERTAPDHALDDSGVPDDEAPPLPGLFRRAGMVVLSPGDLFPALAARPKWFGAMLLAALLTATTGLVPQEVLLEQIARQGAAAQEMALGAVVLRLSSVVGMLVFIPISALVVSGLTYVALVFVRGDEATFKQHLSVISHSGIINGLGVLAFLALAHGGLSVGAESLSVGGLLPFLPDGFLARFLGQVSLFSLWSAVVAGLGLSLLDPRRRWAPTAMVTVGLTLAFPLLVTAIGSAFFSANS